MWPNYHDFISLVNKKIIVFPRICMKKELSSQRREKLLFLSTTKATITSAKNQENERKVIKTTYYCHFENVRVCKPPNSVGWSFDLSLLHSSKVGLITVVYRPRFAEVSFFLFWKYNCLVAAIEKQHAFYHPFSLVMSHVYFLFNPNLLIWNIKMTCVCHNREIYPTYKFTPRLLHLTSKKKLVPCDK